MGRVLIIGHSNELVDAWVARQRCRAHEIDTCEGAVEALHRLQSRAVDVVVTDPETSLREDLALCALLRERRPGVRIIALAPAVAARRRDRGAQGARVRVLYATVRPRGRSRTWSARHSPPMTWSDGIEVVSGAPHWLTLRVSCRLLTADRLVRFMTELQVRGHGRRSRARSAADRLPGDAAERDGARRGLRSRAGHRSDRRANGARDRLPLPRSRVRASTRQRSRTRRRRARPRRSWPPLFIARNRPAARRIRHAHRAAGRR